MRRPFRAKPGLIYGGSGVINVGMGKTYLFECGLCHYRVKVSGGADAGVDCDTQTLLCLDCRELFDVFKRVRRQSKPVGKFMALHPEIPPAALKGSPARVRPWETPALACPMERDDMKHRVEVWKDPGRCPRCGNYMEKNGLPFRVWD